jgi:hypothetical protein
MQHVKQFLKTVLRLKKVVLVVLQVQNSARSVVIADGREFMQYTAANLSRMS